MAKYELNGKEVTIQEFVEATGYSIKAPEWNENYTSGVKFEKPELSWTSCITDNLYLKPFDYNGVRNRYNSTPVVDLLQEEYLKWLERERKQAEDWRKEKLKKAERDYSIFLKKQLGVKHNSNKLPMSKLFEQFPNALQAVVLCSFYGAKKYKEEGIWDNFKKVAGGSQNYKDAGLRHMLDGEIDQESNIPHVFLKLWNAMAETELWIKENNIDIKKYSAEYLDKLK